MPQIQQLFAPPSSAPVSGADTSLVWIVGLAVGFVVFAYIFWSGSRQVRLRNQEAKRKLQSDENEAMRRESNNGMEDYEDDLYGVHPMDVHDDVRSSNNPQYDAMMLQRLEARRRNGRSGDDHRHSNTPGNGGGNHNVFLHPRVFAPEEGDEDYVEGREGREYYDDDAIEEEEIILI